MEALMTTTSFGGELLSFKLDGIEKIHQGEDVRDDNGKVYWKRHAPVLFPIVGKLKNDQTNPIILTSDNGLQLKSKGLGITTISLKEFTKKPK